MEQAFLLEKPLQEEDLEADDHLKALDSRRRNSTISYDVHHDRGTLPSLRIGNYHDRAMVHLLPQTTLDMAPRWIDQISKKHCICSIAVVYLFSFGCIIRFVVLNNLFLIIPSWKSTAG